MHKNVRELKCKRQNPATGTKINAVNISLNSEKDQRKL